MTTCAVLHLVLVDGNPEEGECCGAFRPGPVIVPQWLQALCRWSGQQQTGAALTDVSDLLKQAVTVLCGVACAPNYVLKGN